MRFSTEGASTSVPPPDDEIGRTPTPHRATIAFGRREAATVFVFAIASAVLMSAAVAYNEHQRRSLGFHRVSEEIAREVRERVDAHLAILTATRSLFEAEEQVDRRLFVRFVTPLLIAHPGIGAVEWVPRIAAGERGSFEDAMRTGQPGYTVRELRPEGTTAVAAERSEYHPVKWVVPGTGNEAALGVDLSTDPVRLEALSAARSTGEARVAGPLRLVQAPDDPSGYLVFVPVFRRGGASAPTVVDPQRYRGAVLGVFRVGEIIRAALTRAADYGIDVALSDGGQIVARTNEAAPRQGRSARFVPPFEFETEVDVAGRRLVFAALPTPAYLRERSSPVFLVTVGGAGLLTITLLMYLLLIRRQFAEQEVLAAALRDSETRYRSIVENAPEGLFVYDVDRARFVDVNSRGLALLKTTREALLRSPLSVFNPRFQPDGRESHVAARDMVDRALAGETVVFPWVHRDSKGDVATSEVRLTRLPTADRRLITASVVDTSERRQSELRQLMMARELDHRVKNNLATVLSIAEQTGAEAESFEEFRRKFFARVRAMARVHEQLAATHWEGAELRTVIGAMLEPFADPEGERLILQGPLVILTASAASALSLVLHELGDNAAKHGALSSLRGSVRVRWAVRLEKDLRIVWEERDGIAQGLPGDPGFGMRLVHGLIGHELGGAVDVRYGDAGMTCEMTLPAEHFSVEAVRR